MLSVPVVLINMLSVIVLSVIMLSVIMLNVIVLSVMSSIECGRERVREGMRER
jgi:hypothetical protein